MQKRRKRIISDVGKADQCIKKDLDQVLSLCHNANIKVLTLPLRDNIKQ